MKQASRWFLCCTLAAALALTGCGGGSSGSSSGTMSGSTSAGSSAAQGAAWRTGLGVLTEAAGTDRVGNIRTVAAAVLLDADGKLAGVTLDELELSVSADGTGKVTTHRHPYQAPEGERLPAGRGVRPEKRLGRAGRCLWRLA
jgi:hypothetical protein